MDNESRVDVRGRRRARYFETHRSWREWAVIVAALMLKGGIIVALFR